MNRAALAMVVVGDVCGLIAPWTGALRRGAQVQAGRRKRVSRRKRAGACIHG